LLRTDNNLEESSGALRQAINNKGYNWFGMGGLQRVLQIILRRTPPEESLKASSSLGAEGYQTARHVLLDTDD